MLTLKNFFFSRFVSAASILVRWKGVKNNPLKTAKTLPWHCIDLALTLHWPCLNLALTLPLKFGPNCVSNKTNVAGTNYIVAVEICSWCSQEPIFKVSSKSVQLELRYSWFGQMSRGQMLPGQMSLWQLKSALHVPRNLSLKFHQNQIS